MVRSITFLSLRDGGGGGGSWRRNAGSSTRRLWASAQLLELFFHF